MPEEYLCIEGSDGKGIYGKLRANGKDKLVVHAHGLAQNANSLLEVTSSEFFEAHGYDHYRLSFYDVPDDARKLKDSSPLTHVKDLKAVLAYFADKYDAIYITAHSLGGLVTLILNPPNVRAISFWEPAFDVTTIWATGSFIEHMPQRHEYQLHFGIDYVLGEAMVEEMKNYPDEKCLELAKEVTTPSQFVIAEESIFLFSPRTSPDNYRTAFSGAFDLQRVAGADHVFANEGNRPDLFKTTLKWFEKYP